MEQKETDEIEIDLREICFILLKKIWIIIGSAIAMGLLAFLLTKFTITPLYTSESSIYILTKTTSLTSLADIQAGTQLTADYEILVKSRPVLEQVIKNLKLQKSYQELYDQITVTNPSDTRVLNLDVVDPDPDEAKRIVDELTTVSCKRIAEIMGTRRPSIVNRGYKPEYQTSPNVKKNTALGVLGGAFLAVVIIVVLYLMNDSIKTTEDIEKYLGLNSLAVIPMEEGVSKRSTQIHQKHTLRNYWNAKKAEWRKKLKGKKRG